MPTNSIDEAARQLGAGSLASSLLRAVAQEPATGVSITSLNLRVCYGNLQLAQIFFGPQATPETYIGKHAEEYLPIAWVHERKAHYERSHRSNTPFLLRVLWNDFQHFSWHYPLHQQDDLGVPIFLTITRRVSSDAEALDLAPPGSFDEHEGAFVRLQSLDALTSRELEVLALLGAGLSAGEAATRMSLSEKTIENVRTGIYAKLGLRDRAEMITIAKRAGLLRSDATKPRI